ncbi:ABC transporter permease [Pseudoclavibacter sp. CFCC 11306]|uniref:ABC transporter permease n=1 Tax=Pseudoclavibacter sp. CFCC 11306 TaxID=1564493 RepID=UPI001300FE9F|nr:ABC transporter permease [Pseudoclavibacter sp. CFCC 11306]KAB1658869.1 ABC transporter permease [Pseudoclavibacter sp. CFCC 11306]
MTAPTTVEDSLSALATLRRSSTKTRRGALFPTDPKPWLVTTLVVAITVTVFVVWEALAQAGLINTFFWSSPSAIWKSGVTTLTHGTLIEDTLFTFTSTIWGFVIGVIGGAAIGLSFWWSRLYWKVAEPLLIVFEAMPKLALAPMIVLAFGIGIASKVAVATALVIVIQTLNTSSAVARVDRDLQTLMYSLGASKLQVFGKVVLPSTVPSILSSFRVAIGLALTGAIVGEYMGSEHGLGKTVQMAAANFDIAQIWVGVFALAILSMVLYLVIVVIERLVRHLIEH